MLYIAMPITSTHPVGRCPVMAKLSAHVRCLDLNGQGHSSSRLPCCDGKPLHQHHTLTNQMMRATQLSHLGVGHHPPVVAPNCFCHRAQSTNIAARPTLAYEPIGLQQHNKARRATDVQCQSYYDDGQQGYTATDLSWEDRLALEEQQARERAEEKQRQEEEEKMRKLKKRFRSSWDAVEAGGGRGGGADYLYELGASALYNTNVDTGQNFYLTDSHIAGYFLGSKSDIADGSLRRYEFRSFSNIVGEYYVAPAFMERITLHIVKNYLADLGAIDPKCKVPLILGVWGPKGCGKTFQTELCLKKLGAEAVVMSAGELEHEWAGTPGRLIRERYKKAGELSKVRGKLSALIINDIDAGLGHFENTQVTVNNQIVVGTLMNLCDNPNKVSIGEEWGENTKVRRTPIIVTGNDFSKMFAPLIRDGRMEKFYWKPSRDDLINILYMMYQDDGLTEDDMVTLLDRFPEQPLDFFGALRASTYDNQIRDWIENDVIGERITEESANMAELSSRLARKQNLPKFEPVELHVQDLIREGERLEREQELVLSHNLAHEYLKPQRKIGPGLIGLKG